MKNESKKKNTTSLFLGVFLCTAYYTKGDEEIIQEITLVEQDLEAAYTLAKFYFAVDGLAYSPISVSLLYPLFYSRYHN